MREHEEDLLAKTFQTFGAELFEAGQLQGEEFSEQHLGELWEAVKETYKAGWSYSDLFSVKLSHKARQSLHELAALSYPSMHGKTGYWAQKIKAEAKLRLAKKISDLSGSMTLENQTSRLEEIKHLTTLLEAPVISEKKLDQTERVINFINSLQCEPDFIPTHSPALNELIDGLHKGRLYVLAARTSMGKTAVALNLSWGLKGRAKVAFYSLEMIENEIIARLMSLETGLAHSRIKPRADTETNEVLARKYLPVMAEAGLEIVYNRQGFTMAELRSHALQLKAEGKLEVLVIDQLDKIKPSGRLANATPYDILTKHSTQLKQLALELEVPILLLHQINREGNDEPQLVHLKGSGQIEQDADLVFILHRKQDPDQKEIELIFSVAKNRHGKTGKIFYRWQGDLMRLGEPASTGFRPKPFNPADSVATYYSPAGTAF